MNKINQHNFEFSLICGECDLAFSRCVSDNMLRPRSASCCVLEVPHAIKYDQYWTSLIEFILEALEELIIADSPLLSFTQTSKRINFEK